MLHFVAEPYLDIGNGKTWRPAVVNMIAGMVESEQKAKRMMVQGFKMGELQVRFWTFIRIKIKKKCLAIY